MKNPAAFISYARRDDAAYSRQITGLRQKLQGMVASAIGLDFEIFQDRQGIAWGQHWPTRLDEALEEALFLIPILTPSYFNSEACRAELETFLQLERRSGRKDRVLPLYFLDAPVYEQKTDPLAAILHERQHCDWRPLRVDPLGSPKVLRALDSLAKEIAETIHTQQAVTSPPARRGAMPVVSEPLSPAAAALENTKPWWTLTATLAWVMTRDPAVVAKLCGPLSAVDKGAIILESAGRGKGVRESREELVNVLATGRVTAHGDCQDGRGLKPIPAVEWSRLKFGFESGSDAAGPHREVILKRAEVVQHWPPKAGDVLRAPGTVFRDIDAPWCPELVVIPAGTFVMGSPEDEAERTKAEGPQHRVTFATPFALGRYPVTFEEYDHFCVEVGREKPPDQGWGRGRRPAINVSWEDARAYCAWLSEPTRQPYRLPSEAEWEYACRAGTTTPFWTGATISTEQANYDGNYTYGSGRKAEYRKRTTPVDTFEANPWSLYDMHGNVWEWCEDCWNDSYAGAPKDGSAWTSGDCGRRVLRGGSRSNDPRNLRSAYRDGVAADRRDGIGFRIARMLGADPQVASSTLDCLPVVLGLDPRTPCMSQLLSNPNSRSGRPRSSPYSQGRVMEHSPATPTFDGIDVAKDRLDVHLRPSDEAFALSRARTGADCTVWPAARRERHKCLGRERG